MCIDISGRIMVMPNFNHPMILDRTSHHLLSQSVSQPLNGSRTFRAFLHVMPLSFRVLFSGLISRYLFLLSFSDFHSHRPVLCFRVEVISRSSFRVLFTISGRFIFVRMLHPPLILTSFDSLHFLSFPL
jgi:hypothetical protein